MKRTLTLILSVLCLILFSGLYARASEDNVFLTNTTAWIEGIGYEQDDIYQTSEISIRYITTAGDTLIDGMPYYRMHVARICNPHIYMDIDEKGNEYVKEKWLDVTDSNTFFFMREDANGDVWLYVDDESVFRALTDNTLFSYFADKLICRDLFLFNARKTYSVGEKMPLGVFVLESTSRKPDRENEAWCIDSLRIVEVDDEVMQDGLLYKTFISGSYYNGEVIRSVSFVQGIGPLWSGPLSGLGSPNSTFQRNYFAFYRNDRLLYKNEGYVSALERYFPDILDILIGKKNPDGIVLTQKPSTDKKAIYNLQGLRLQKAPEKGLYIQDGKKVVIK